MYICKGDKTLQLYSAHYIQTVWINVYKTDKNKHLVKMQQLMYLKYHAIQSINNRIFKKRWNVKHKTNTSVKYQIVHFEIASLGEGVSSEGPCPF